MSDNKEIKVVSVEGAYAIPRLSNSTVVIGIPDEDIGKKESVDSWETLQSIVPGMLSVISGKIDPIDLDPKHTLAREAYEEQGLKRRPEDFQNGLSKVRVLQERPGRRYDFLVQGHSFSVTPQEAEQLSLQFGINVIEDPQLQNYLEENERILRPSAFAILKLYLEDLERESSKSIRIK